MSIYVGYDPDRPAWEPNCQDSDRHRVDGPGLVHDWWHVTDNAPGDLYHCTRCGCTDID